MDVTLTAQARPTTGSSVSRRMRTAGQIPAVVYGLGSEARAITVEWTDLRKALTTDAGANALIELTIDGETNLSIVKDLQRHAIRRDVLHVDFQLIDRNAALAIEIPVVLVGIAPKVEQFKGMVEQLKHTLSVKAKPGSFPNQLEADISELEIGSTFKVSDVILPDGVSTDVDPEDVIAQGAATRSTILLMNDGVDPDDVVEGAPAAEAAAD